MLLSNKDVLVNTRFFDGLTLLHVAAMKNHEAVARALIESDADVDINATVIVFFFCFFYVHDLSFKEQKHSRFFFLCWP